MPSPGSLVVITATNADKLEQIEVLGSGTLETVAVSSDGRLIAVGGSAGVNLFTAETQTPLRQIATGFEVYSIDFPPDSKQLAVVGDNCNVYLWNVSDGSLAQTLRGHQWGVSDVSFSPDGRFLATVSWDHSLRVWQTDDGSQVLQAFDQRLSIFNHVAFAPDSEAIAWSTGYPDNAVRVFRLPDGQVTHSLLNPVDDNTSVMDITFSPDGELIAIGTMGAGAWVWRLSEDKLVYQTDEVKDIYAIAFSPDGSLLATASQSAGAPRILEHERLAGSWRFRHQFRLV